MKLKEVRSFQGECTVLFTPIIVGARLPVPRKRLRLFRSHLAEFKEGKAQNKVLPPGIETFLPVQREIHGGWHLYNQEVHPKKEATMNARSGT